MTFLHLSDKVQGSADDQGIRQVHIVRQLSEAVDKIRRQEVTEKNKEHKGILASTRYIWVKNPWNLTDRHKASLSFLETLNLKIHQANLLNESFRGFWQSATSVMAAKFLEHWFRLARESKIKPRQDFTLPLKHLVAGWDHRLPTDFSEEPYLFKSASTCGKPTKDSDGNVLRKAKVFS